jgi:hypothetical protein
MPNDAASMDVHTVKRGLKNMQEAHGATVARQKKKKRDV